MPDYKGTGLRMSSGYTPPDKYDQALMAGIRLFVLAYNKLCPDRYPRTLSGPFDVVVAENFTQGSASRYSEKWITGSDANIKFECVDNRGTLIAWMPDDRFYHNRMILADQPGLRLLEMQTGYDGVVPASVVNMEIQCLREVVNEMAPIYKIIGQQGKEIDYFWNEAEAREFINQEQTVLRGSAQVPVQISPYKACKIEKGEKMRRRAYILRMIQEHARDPYGWTACEEFRTKVIPQVNALISERSHTLKLDGDASGAAPDLRSAVMDIIAGLSEEQIRELKRLRGAPVAAEPSADDGQFEHKKYARSALQKMQLAELRDIAATRGIMVDTEATKGDIIDKVMSQQAEPAPTGERVITQDIPVEEELIT